MLQRIIIKIKKNLWFLNVRYKHFGKKSVIYKPMMLKGKKYISVGKKVMIRNNARIEMVDKWGNEKFFPNLTIGDYTSIEQGLHLTCAGNIKIGHDCVFTGNIMITNIIHSCKTMNINILKNPLEIKDVTIGDYCFFGFGSQVLPGVTIGNNCIIGAGAIVTKDIPDYSMVVGNPARVIKKYDPEKKDWIKIER